MYRITFSYHDYAISTFPVNNNNAMILDGIDYVNRITNFLLISSYFAISVTNSDFYSFASYVICLC
jgi:hypothetical protein